MATLTMETTMAGESGPRWRKRTARFDEIAALAGVSTTTVDLSLIHI